MRNVVFSFLSKGHTLKQFEEFFWKTPLGRYVSEASHDMQMEFFHRYLQDFISMTMSVTSKVDLEVRARPLRRYCANTWACLCADVIVYLFLRCSSYVEPLRVLYMSTEVDRNHVRVKLSLCRGFMPLTITSRAEYRTSTE